MTETPDKPALRRRMRARRRQAVDPLAASQAAQALPLDALPPFRVVSGYRAQGTELDPAPLLARFAKAGAAIALPVCLDRVTLVFRRHSPGDPLTPDALGIPSPPATAEPLTPDLVIAPLLAFDRRGARLGQGAGHYDRAIAALRKGGPTFVLGLAYAAQELPDLPSEPHDERLDAILTEKGYIAVRP